MNTWTIGCAASILMALSLSALGQTPPPDEAEPSQSAPPLKLPPNVKLLREIEYARPGDKPLALDLYLPASSEPLPLIVWIHGGGWRGGDKGSMVTATFLSGHGYAVASVNYRLSRDAVFPAQIHDCKAAIRWLKAHAAEYSLDPQRIGVFGRSAGGHLAALVGTTAHVKALEGEGNSEQSSRVLAVCDWFGPTDLLQMAAHQLPGGKFDHDSPDAPGATLIGGPVQQNKDKAAAASPLTYLTPDTPPFLIVHGDQDTTVPLHQSQLLYDALQRAGVPATMHIVAGGGHGGPPFNTPESYARVQQFFDQHLKGSNPSPSAHHTPRKNDE